MLLKKKFNERTKVPLGFALEQCGKQQFEDNTGDGQAGRQAGALPQFFLKPK